MLSRRRNTYPPPPAPGPPSRALTSRVSSSLPVPPRLLLNTTATQQAEALSVQCCKVMAVIGAKLRALANASCSSGGTLPTHRRPSSRTMTILRAANRHVKRLAAAAAPGGGENQYGIDSVDLGGGGSVHGTAGRFAGLSLAGAVTVRENCLGSRGANALVGTCAALHVHLLEWLQVTNTDLDARRGCEAHGLREGGGGDDACDSSRMYPGNWLFYFCAFIPLTVEFA